MLNELQGTAVRIDRKALGRANDKQPIERMPPEVFSQVRQQAMPDADELAVAVRDELARNRFAVVRGIQFNDLSEAEREVALLAFSSGLGEPSLHDGSNSRFVWPVTPDGSATQPTITQRDGEAELHTDSSFREIPERLVVLYCVRPADHGGVNLLVQAERVIESLAETEQGRSSLDILRREAAPFAVPRVFCADRAVPESITAQILAPERLRWRFEQVLSGFQLRPELRSTTLNHALHVFLAATKRIVPHEVSLRAGDLLVVDNNWALHGRTAFSDPRRLLLRIRLT